MVGNGWSKTRPVQWVHERSDPERARSLAEAVGVSPLVAQILVNRGYPEPDAARTFLHPALTDLADPLEIPELDTAAELIARHARDGSRIVVYGDYDVDGITGTALLTTFFRQLGAEVTPYLPDRMEEGYGLNEAAVRRIAENGTNLLVTVDHGTTAVEEIRLARELGMDVVVLDHHTPAEERPPANALVNPLLWGEPGPWPCGVGVAFKLVWGLARHLAGGPRVSESHRQFLTEALDLVAMGTVSDVVPLSKENRVFTRFGLGVLARTSRPGLRALIEASGADTENLTAVDIGYKLAPRINAAGRLGEAGLALELLLTEDPARATEIATLLDGENRRRRTIDTRIYSEAADRLEQEFTPDHVGGISMGDEGWHAGVIGIVASRIVDRYGFPAALVAFDGKIGRGSCRSVPALHLVDALSECAEHLESFGGHAAAAGFSIRPEQFPAFKEAFERVTAETLTKADLVKKLRIDVTAPLAAITPACVKDLDRLAPFGEGNPQPVFATHGARIAGKPRRVGKAGAHLSLLITDGNQTLKAVGFNMGTRSDALRDAPDGVDIAYTLGFDRWRNDGSVELSLRDIAVSNGRSTG